MELKQQYIEQLKKDIWYRPGTKDEVVIKDTFEGLYHMPPVLIHPKSVLDLGANIGLTMAHYELMWPDAKIVGYEMDVDNAIIASKNTDSTVISYAISKRSGVQTYGGDDESGYALGKGDKFVIGITLDDLAEKYADVHFVKMDIEGAEVDVLNSGYVWPFSFRTMLIEVHNDYPLERIELALQERNYKCERHPRHWSSIWAYH